MSKVLITGGAGFIGSNLARSLVDENEITVVDDLSMGKIDNISNINVNFYEHDVRDKTFMHKLLLDNQFDYIYFLAAISSVADSVIRPIETHTVNQEAVLDTLEFIRVNKIPIKKFLFTSSAAVYGNLPDFPKKESSGVQPLTPYAIDKYASERFTIDYGNLYDVPTIAVRFFNVFGPRQNPDSPFSGVLSIVTQCFNNDKTFTMYGNGSQTRDFIYVKDVVNALIMLAKSKEKATVFNVANGNETSLKDIIQTYEKITKKKLKIQRKVSREGDISRSKADITKIKKLGFNPKYSLYDGLLEYWKYQQNI